jgi:hypothetical protein
MSAFGRKSRYCQPTAAAATISAYAMRGPRRFGIVIGSEIMKKANNSSAPLPSWCHQIAHD